MSRRSSIIVAVALLIGMTALFRAGAGSDERVNVLCSPDLAWCEAIGPAFREATDIELAFLRVSSQDALARIRAEAANPIFDVWFGGTGDPHLIAAREGLTEFYEPSVWEALRDAFKEQVGGAYIPLYAGALGFVVNETALGDAQRPRTWRDLTDPAYRRLIAMPDPNSSGTGYTIIATLVELYGEEEAFEILTGLHRNVAHYTSSGSAPGQLAGRGEVAIAIQFMHDGVKFAAQGYPLTVYSPEDGTGYEIGGLSLIAGAPNRGAAIAFIEWALTPEAQRLAAERGDSYQIPSNRATPVPDLAPDLATLPRVAYDFDRFGSPAVRAHLVGRWTDEILPRPR